MAKPWGSGPRNEIDRRVECAPRRSTIPQDGLHNRVRPPECPIRQPKIMEL